MGGAMTDLIKSMENKYKMYPSNSLEWKIIAEVKRLRIEDSVLDAPFRLHMEKIEAENVLMRTVLTAIKTIITCE